MGSRNRVPVGSRTVATRRRVLGMAAGMTTTLALARAGMAHQAATPTTGWSFTDDKGVTPARTQSYFAQAYGIEGDVFELTVAADSPLVGMSLGEAEALHAAPLVLALKSGNAVVLRG